MEPLFNDEYIGLPAKRILSQLLKYREEGAKIVGTYCSYAPLEIPRAMGLLPVVLCAFSNNTVAAAEAILPANLCPLIKSSYGFIETDTCPFFSISDAVIAETTCDGKKKMFELIVDRRPLFVMDLPQVPAHAEALTHWTSVVRRLTSFLETTFDKKIEDTMLEEAIRDTNRKNSLVMKIFEYASYDPPYIAWKEMLDISFLAQPLSGVQINSVLEEKIAMLEKRRKSGESAARQGAPRILVTGCPLAGDSTKVLKAIEAEGAVIVAMDSCTGMKPFNGHIEENTGDPIAAVARRYLEIPCSCMTPNSGRLDEISRLVDKFKPDAVIDVVLHACHSYNIESLKVEKHVISGHSLPFLKVVTDYSGEDMGQIQTRVGALIEMVKK